MRSVVRIAGGGLSGLATAVLLAERGVPVEVFERRSNRGGRFTGGWQVLENGTSLEDAVTELGRLGFPASPPVTQVREATLFDGRGGVHRVRSAAPYAYFVRRGPVASLDSWLVEAARSLGVVVRDETPAPAKVDVVATGPRQADGVARETVFSSDLPDTVAVLFDPQVTPTGYAYLFCIAGHATFGVAQVRGVAGLREASRAAWDVFRRQFGTFPVEQPVESGQFMNFSLPSRLVDDEGRWYVGEAAGVQDFLFGLGNRLALRTAALVAAEIVGDPSPVDPRLEILRPMRSSVALRAVYERLGRRGTARLCRWLAGGDFRQRLLWLQRPDLAKALFGALARPLWKERRGCRHGPLCDWCRRTEQ